MPGPGDNAAVLRLDGSTASDLDRLHPWFDAASGDLPARLRHAMSVALEEAVMNVAMHAFPPGTEGDITVRLLNARDSVALVVEDPGPAFDPTTAPARERPANMLDAEPGGLGLTLLRHYCRDIAYERAGDRNRLTLRFRLEPD